MVEAVDAQSVRRRAGRTPVGRRAAADPDRARADQPPAVAAARRAAGQPRPAQRPGGRRAALPDRRRAADRGAHLRPRDEPAVAGDGPDRVPRRRPRRQRHRRGGRALRRAQPPLRPPRRRAPRPRSRARRRRRRPRRARSRSTTPATRRPPSRSSDDGSSCAPSSQRSSRLGSSPRARSSSRSSSARWWRSSPRAVGVFTVIRGQSFAGEALGDIGAAGGSSAYLVGVAPLWGFVGISVAAAGVMELIGIQRARGRDLATGIVLGAGFGLAALFLYLGTTSQQHDRRDRHDPVRIDLRARHVDPAAGGRVRRRSRSRRSSCSTGRCCSSRSAPSSPPRAASGAADRQPLPAGDGARGGALRGHDRRDPLHRAARRAGRHRACAHAPARPRDRVRRR